MKITKTVRVNEFGVHEFPPNLGDSLIGKSVAIRDWYGEVRGTVLSVSLGSKGYPSSLEIETSNGHVPAFGLFSAREIEVL